MCMQMTMFIVYIILCRCILVDLFMCVSFFDVYVIYYMNHSIWNLVIMQHSFITECPNLMNVFEKYKVIHDLILYISVVTSFVNDSLSLFLSPR